MRGLLLDTHIWFWYLSGSERLEERIRTEIEVAPSPCWLSPISIWELAMLERRSRVHLGDGVRAWLEQALRLLPVREAGLSREVALRSQEIQLPHRDPADHFLAATALVYELTIATMDSRLIGADWLPTLSG